MKDYAISASIILAAIIIALTIKYIQGDIGRYQAVFVQNSNMANRFNLFITDTKTGKTEETNPTQNKTFKPLCAPEIAKQVLGTNEQQGILLKWDDIKDKTKDEIAQLLLGKGGDYNIQSAYINKIRTEERLAALKAKKDAVNPQEIAELEMFLTRDRMVIDAAVDQHLQKAMDSK
jgi:hypothetical protein